MELELASLVIVLVSIFLIKAGRFLYEKREDFKHDWVFTRECGDIKGVSHFYECSRCSASKEVQNNF